MPAGHGSVDVQAIKELAGIFAAVSCFSMLRRACIAGRRY